MTLDEKRALRLRNLRTGLIFATIAVAGFIGIIARNWLMAQ